MNIQEYEHVKIYSYNEYCDYLQEKYGISKYNYFTPMFKRNNKVSRTNEGLVTHHKYENHEPLLSKKEEAVKYPYEWQLATNLVYCDYLEHLFLHILICESPGFSIQKPIGIGGLLCFIMPELNDVYCGWKTKQQWRMNCHNRIINDKDVYLELIRRFKTVHKECPQSLLLKSFNEQFGLWATNKNKELYGEIIEL